MSFRQKLYVAAAAVCVTMVAISVTVRSTELPYELFDATPIGALVPGWIQLAGDAGVHVFVLAGFVKLSTTIGGWNGTRLERNEQENRGGTWHSQ